MPRYRSPIARGFETASNSFASGYLEKLQREKMMGNIQYLLSQKDPRPIRPANEMGYNLEEEAFQKRPVFDQKNALQLSQLPPQVLNLLSQIQSMNQPQEYNLSRGEERFRQDVSGGRPVDKPRKIAQGAPWMQAPNFDWRARTDPEGQFKTQTVPGTDDVRIVEEQYDPVTGQPTGAIRSATGGAPPFGGMGSLGRDRQLVPTDKGFRVYNKKINQWEDIPGPKEYKITPAEIKLQLTNLKDNEKTVQQIRQIVGRSEVTGPVTGRARKLGSRFFSDRDAQDLINTTAQLRTVIYGLSGKQINEAELDWLNNEILPKIEQPDDNFEVTLSRFESWLKQRIGSIEQSYPGSVVDEKQEIEMPSDSTGQKRLEDMTDEELDARLKAAEGR